MRIRACMNEILFLVAEEFVELSDQQKFAIGIKLGLVTVGAALYSPKHLEEMVFSMAYKKNKIAELVKQIQMVKDVASPA